MERLDKKEDDNIHPVNKQKDIWKGLLIVIIGATFLAREMGAYIPHWVFSWQMLLIVIGFYITVKHSFQNAGGYILMFIGGAFLLQDFIPDYDFSNYLWPVGLIMVGVFVMIRPKRNRHTYWHERRAERLKNRYEKRWEHKQDQWKTEPTSEEYMEVNAVFGGIRKNIISKDFKGGEINAVFGGAEINLSQAGINGQVTLEVNAVFGGARLIIPADWEVKSELVAVLGNVEDKRPLVKDFNPTGKVLVLKGTAVFGGIDITSF